MYPKILKLGEFFAVKKKMGSKRSMRIIVRGDKLLFLAIETYPLYPVFLSETEASALITWYGLPMSSHL